MVERTGAKKCKKEDEVVPGIELGLPESESDVLTITLYNLVVEANFIVAKYIVHSISRYAIIAFRTTLTHFWTRQWHCCGQIQVLAHCVHCRTR